MNQGESRSMFGTSGIRGVYGKEITEELAERIGFIFSKIGNDKHKSKANVIVVGRDIRASGPSLFRHLAKGINSAGVDVLDLGVVPTPTVALATKLYGCRGIMITASHNPPEFNGLKLIENSKEIGKELEIEITKEYRKMDVMDSELAGSIYSEPSIIEAHKRMVKSMIDCKKIARKKPKVVVDCNGAGSVIMPYLLSELGCIVISVNASLNCFNRPSEPNAKNLEHLKEFIPKIGADFGIANDGDCDRCVIIDEMGNVLPFDGQLAMMIDQEMAQVEKADVMSIISTVEASLTIREHVEAAGGKIEITPVGSTFIGDRMEEVDALFGGEPCGEYIYGQGVHVPDAVLAAAKFVGIYCEKGKFSKLIKSYPQNPIAREKFRAEDKFGAIERIKKEIRSSKEFSGRIRIDDGIRVDQNDGWFLIRASGTEPIIRLTMEYKDQRRLDDTKKRLVEIIERNMQLK